jgi:DNA-binding MarR family transcriptional regulator
LAQVNLKLLHMFVAVAGNRSFRMAAEQLNRSQSAVSMQIKQLEEQVGVAIFHRTTRRVELTSEGERLLAHARRALEEWEDGLRQIRDVVDIQRGTLSIGCVPTVAATILPKALSAFRTAYPGINVNLREQATHDLLESIRRREIDFGIGPAVEGSAEFQFGLLFNRKCRPDLGNGIRRAGSRKLMFVSFGQRQKTGPDERVCLFSQRPHQPDTLFNEPCHLKQPHATNEAVFSALASSAVNTLARCERNCPQPQRLYICRANRRLQRGGGESVFAIPSARFAASSFAKADAILRHDLVGIQFSYGTQASGSFTVDAAR